MYCATEIDCLNTILQQIQSPPDSYWIWEFILSIFRNLFVIILLYALVCLLTAFPRILRIIMRPLIILKLSLHQQDQEMTPIVFGVDQQH